MMILVRMMTSFYLRNIFLLSLIIAFWSGKLIIAEEKDGIDIILEGRKELLLGKKLYLTVVVKNKGDKKVTFPYPENGVATESYFRHHINHAFQKISKNKKAQAVPTTFIYQSYVVDTAKNVVVEPGKSIQFKINLRENFDFPFEEVGKYKFLFTFKETKSKAELSFEIKKKPSVIMRQVFRQGKKNKPLWEYLVLKNNKKDSAYSLAIRKKNGILFSFFDIKNKPLSIGPSETRNRRFLYWLESDELKVIHPPGLVKVFTHHKPLNAKSIRSFSIPGALSIKNVESTFSVNKYTEIFAVYRIQYETKKGLRKLYIQSKGLTELSSEKQFLETQKTRVEQIIQNKIKRENEHQKQLELWKKDAEKPRVLSIEEKRKQRERKMSYLLDRGKSDAQARVYDRAKATFETVVKDYPGTLYANEANRLLTAIEKNKEAIKTYEEKIDVYPEFRLWKEGKKAYEKEEWEKALKIYIEYINFPFTKSRPGARKKVIKKIRFLQNKEYERTMKAEDLKSKIRYDKAYLKRGKIDLARGGWYSAQVNFEGLLRSKYDLPEEKKEAEKLLKLAKYYDSHREEGKKYLLKLKEAKTVKPDIKKTEAIKKTEPIKKKSLPKELLKKTDEANPSNSELPKENDEFPWIYIAGGIFIVILGSLLAFATLRGKNKSNLN